MSLQAEIGDKNKFSEMQIKMTSFRFTFYFRILFFEW